MKKYLVTSLVLLSMLIVQVGTVAAAPMASGTVSLVSVSHGFKGPIFTFTVSGDFSKKDLKGAVHVQGGSDYGLHCAQKDDTTVTCTTSDKVSGVNVSVTFGGSTFWTYVPEAPSEPIQYCYSILLVSLGGKLHSLGCTFGSLKQSFTARVLSYYFNDGPVMFN